MKKLLFIIVMAIISISVAFAQEEITLSFVCQTTDGDYLQPDSIVIENLSRNWSETIYYPDTVYILNLETNVSSRTKDVDMQVMPNPFEGTTHVNILSAAVESIRMILIDMSGRVCAEYNGSLQEGGNLFTISLTTPQTYVLSVQTSSGNHSIKMENVGRAGENKIAYGGASGDVAPVVKLKSVSTHVFELGDEMRYTGYCLLNNGAIPSVPVTQHQNESSEIVLYFQTEVEDGMPCPGVTTVVDVDGNVYNTVQIGNQCWMKENLRTTHYANGTVISFGGNLGCNANATNYSVTSPYYYNNVDVNTPSCGLLYNWPAIMNASSSSNSNPSGVQGICPNGWHVPSSSEWNQLTSYVGSLSQYHCGGEIAKSLCAASSGWNQWYCFYNVDPIPIGEYDVCSPGYSVSNNNATGFSAMPAGTTDGVYENHLVYYGEVPTSRFWSSTSFSANTANCRTIFGITPDVLNEIDYGDMGIDTHNAGSVRCVKDNNSSQSSTIPSVETGMVNNITTSSANCGGNVVSDGGATVTARGVCWNTTSNPTITDNHTIDGAGIGSFTSSLTGLMTNTTYYVRTYAINVEGIAYGEERSFTTLAATVPTVITQTLTNVGFSSAVCGGNVLSDGGATVTARGVCWDTTSNPTITDNHTTNGAGIGSFTSSLTGLMENTTYYVRAYAINAEGIAYGEVRSFTTLAATVPTVSTQASINAGVFSAVCGGNVLSDGGATVTARGVCWDTTSNPTITDNHTIDGAGIGSFTSSLTGLMANTAYYVRAYATNSVGTAYGDQIMFTTINAGMPCSGTPTLTDYDGNVYNTVQIGEQCWMRENLRTTHYLDGNPIISRIYVTVSSQGVTDTIGIKYNLASLMSREEASNSNPSGVQSVCPFGWHLPSVSEFEELFAFVKNHDVFLCNGDTNHIGDALGYSSSSTCEWLHNATGFSASYDRLRTCTNTQSDHFYFVMFYSDGRVRTVNDSEGEMGGLLNAVVRCVRNEGVSVSTIFNEVTTTTASIRSIIANTGSDSVVSHGVCWSNSPSPAINGNNVIYGNVENMMSDTILITGLAFGQHYYVRAFANTNNGVIYGNEILVHLSCHGDTPLVDYDGNTYHSVQIGSQCWMKEDMHTTHYADGTEINSYSYRSTNYGNDFGYLYLWNTAMQNQSSSSSTPSGIQGLCPDGWHLPSDGEWTVLTDYVSSQPQHACNNNSDMIAKSLASELYWSLNTSPYCAVGTILSSPNNVTGFSAKPVRYNNNNGTVQIGAYAYFMSTTRKDNDSIWARRISYESAYVNKVPVYRNGMYAVRCISNNGWAEVLIDSISIISDSSASVSGQVLTDGGNAVTDRGVCWSIDANPTVSGQHLSVGIGGTGVFSCNLNGLTPGTIYYVRAYAVNSSGISYSNDFTYVTPNSNDAQPCTDAVTVSDYDGNVYNTVQVGSQCWLKENLRTTHYSDGEAIVLGNANMNVYRCYPNNDSINIPMYGYLYSWRAVMRNSTSSNANPSSVQGICPNGWHVPSRDELQQLIDYVNSQDKYVSKAKALADSVGWNQWTYGPCFVGYNMSANNATGFSARGAGSSNGLYASDFNSKSYVLSSTTDNSLPSSLVVPNGMSCQLSINRLVEAGSVRCVKN